MTKIRVSAHSLAIETGRYSRLKIPGTYKVRNEIETKLNEINETKSTKTKRNQRKRNETKRKRNEMETKWNETNEIDWYEENGRKQIKDKMK